MMQTKLFEFSNYKSGFVNTMYIWPFIIMLTPFRREVRSQILLALSNDNNTAIFIYFSSLVLLSFIINAIKQFHDCAKDNKKKFSIRLLITNSAITMCLTLGGMYLSWYCLDLAMVWAGITAIAVNILMSDLAGYGGLQPLGSSPVNIVKPSNKSFIPNTLFMEGDRGNPNTVSQPESSAGNIGSNNNVVSPSYNTKFPTSDPDEKNINYMSDQLEADTNSVISQIKTIFKDHLVGKGKISENQASSLDPTSNLQKVKSLDEIDSMLKKFKSGSSAWRLAKLNYQEERNDLLEDNRSKALTEGMNLLNKYYPDHGNDPEISPIIRNLLSSTLSVNFLLADKMEEIKKNLG